VIDSELWKGTDRKIVDGRACSEKKTDVLEHLKVFDHVGVLANEPPGLAGLPFV
jgi:hypothetical protein